VSKRDQSQKPLPACEQAVQHLGSHYLLGPVLEHVSRDYAKRRNIAMPPKAYCQIKGARTLVLNDHLNLPVVTWTGVISLATLVLALGATKRLPTPSPLSDLAAQLAALHWWRNMRVGTLPDHFEIQADLAQWGRLPLEKIVERLEDESNNALMDGTWTLTRSSQVPLLLPGDSVYHNYYQATDLEQVFANAMVDNAKKALQMHHASAQTLHPGSDPNSNAARAKRWLISHFPLLGSLLTRFELIEDIEICRRMDIHVAAIQISTGEIYINPARHLTEEQAKFVVAHEVLHAGLNHSSRRQGREPYLWNVACDFVINDWLVTMGVGTPPDIGMLYDEELRGWSADDIYLRLASDLRIRRRLCTLRGQGVDILDERGDGRFTDREAFCRQALLQGLDYHQAMGRGTLPAGLVEAIRTLNQPPIPWQAKLAEWIQERFPLPERRRSYAKPSRRQSVTPEFPRPRFIEPEDDRVTRTFGVILDTSGSMQRDELGKAIGAVVSYSMAQGVKQVRLIFCDATPYDEGYVEIEALASRVTVRGRGGTVLQPAVQLLETRQDFPKQCPILIITDGLCEDIISVQRDHAFLLTPGARLPFITRKPVFYMS
jgi:predicted metal-dependent peptidase